MAMTHNMRLKQPHFDMMNTGTKDIECRLYDDKRRKIRVGDKIVFSNGDKSFTRTVAGLFIAKDFKKLFSLVDASHAGFGNAANAVNVMQEFYDLDAQAKFGVVGIVLEK